MSPSPSLKGGLQWLLIGLMIACHRPSTSDEYTRAQSSTVPSTHRPSDGEDCENTFTVDTVPPNEDLHHGIRVPNEAALPDRLSETGLYTNIEAKTIHPAFLAYTPRFELWSDTAEKNRWIYIPECDVIDSSDMNDWSFPVGTRAFKEFVVDGKRIETRIIERLGPGPRDFAFASYQWNTDESEATKVSAAGEPNASETSHDIPSKSQCLQCHGSYSMGGGRPSRSLSFSAVQLSHEDSGISLEELAAEGVISKAPDTPPSIPGTPTDQAALGYLHANCGNCHNSTSDRVPQNTLDLWINVGLSSVEETAAWRTAVDQPNQMFKDQHVAGRIVPGAPDTSAVLYRMSIRGNSGQMPPVASKVIDPEGIETITEWIGGL